MLIRTLIVLAIGIIVLFQAAIIAVMKDSAKGDKQLFQKWLVYWALVNTGIVLTTHYIITGTILELG
jgi:hypothetical protein